MGIFAYIRKYIPEFSIEYIFVLLVILASSFIYAMHLRKIKNICHVQLVSIILFPVYVVFLFLSAVVLRTSEGSSRINIELFWTIKACIYDGKYFWPEIVANIFMMFPFGVLFPVIVSIRGCKEKMKFIGTVFVGIFISVVVECFQYLFHRGLTDIDDIMHNGIGVTLGYLTNFMIRKLDIEVNRLRRKGKGL